MITEANFKTLIPDVNWQYAQQYVALFETVLPTYGIDTPIRKAHFLAQVTHESGGFKYVKENLNYSANALYAVFRKYFPNMNTANQYARQPEKIANVVYANRLGNGTGVSGDGWRYRGRGLIQLTGKDNYRSFSAATGQDFVSNPAMVEEATWALSSACWFWKSKNLNRYADQDDVILVTKRINGGTNGLANRQHYLEEYKKLFNIYKLSE